MAGQDNRGIGNDPINCLETSAGLANSKQVMLHRTNGRGGSELFDESGFLVLRGKFSWQRVGGRSYNNDYAQVQQLRLKDKKPIPPYWEEEIKQGELNVIGTAEPETRIISAEATRTAGLVCDGRAVSRRSAQ